MLYFTVEKAKDVIDEMKPLIEAHWEEIALNKDKIKLDPDYDRYVAMGEMGLLSIVTARDCGVLVGYCIDIVAPHLHYKSSVFAINDILYLHPDYRKGKNAIQLLNYAGTYLKNLGAKVHILHMKTEHAFTALAEYMGYKQIEYNYCKDLGD